MIKNDVQLKNSIELLQKIDQNIKEITKDPPSLFPKDFLLEPYLQQYKAVESEIKEYYLLRSIDLKLAVSSALDYPVLLENAGELLAKLRIASKLTQAEMANKLGWEQSNVSRFESENYSGQTISKIIEYANALGIWLHIRPSLNEEIDVEESLARKIRRNRVFYNTNTSTTSGSIDNINFSTQAETQNITSCISCEIV